MSVLLVAAALAFGMMVLALLTWAGAYISAFAIVIGVVWLVGRASAETKK